MYEDNYIFYSIFETDLGLFLISFQNWKWKIKKRGHSREPVSPLNGCPCRWAWRWTTHRRCCWWATPRTLAPARQRRRTANRARRSSTWWAAVTRVLSCVLGFLSHHRRSCACYLPAVWVPVLPVPRQGPVQEDERQEGRAAVVVLREGTQQDEERRQLRRPEGASVSGRLPLRGHVLARLRRLAVSDLGGSSAFGSLRR